LGGPQQRFIHQYVGSMKCCKRIFNVFHKC